MTRPTAPPQHLEHWFDRTLAMYRLKEFVPPKGLTERDRADWIPVGELEQIDVYNNPEQLKVFRSKHELVTAHLTGDSDYCDEPDPSDDVALVGVPIDFQAWKSNPAGAENMRMWDDAFDSWMAAVEWALANPNLTVVNKNRIPIRLMDTARIEKQYD